MIRDMKGSVAIWGKENCYYVMMNCHYAEDIKKMIDDLYPVLYEIQTETDQSFNIDAQFDIYFLDIDMPSISWF